ncbi:hypothetical protein LguiB_020867 [Lonicera macranthoides]
MKKAGKKIAKVDKPFVKESSRPTVFKCNLVVVVEEIGKLMAHGDIKDVHMEAMIRTRFGALFKAIYEDKIILDHVGMIGQVRKKIISAYSEKHDGFLISGEVVKFTPNDVFVTFGFSKHGRKFTMQSGESVNDSEFMQRRFRSESSLKVTNLLSAVHTMVAIGLSFVPYVEDLDKFCERYKCVQPYNSHSNDMPRFVRWTINALRRMLLDFELSDLDPSNPQVVKEGVEKGDDKDAEIKALKNRVAELELLFQLNRSNKLIEPKFILCNKPDEDDPGSYVDLVCSGVQGDLQFEREEKEEEDVEVEKEKKDIEKDIEEEMEKNRAVREGEKYIGEDQNQSNKVVNDYPTFDLNLVLSWESKKEVYSQKEKLGNEAEEATPPLVEERVINVDDLPTPDNEEHQPSAGQLVLNQFSTFKMGTIFVDMGVKPV